ncbi:uncharacterized protein LTR77_003603 [Saxophila tyrrhenica]|uniref:NmrA-like domain-containing protein n=1 Tax=Saxophila tyrrhenica TaxID=1690608 RepID=A0AAV9PEA9_9PEZI|nr:hypothetical protein LTR77_003603 [Saxophila tyrrhenica]
MGSASPFKNVLLFGAGGDRIGYHVLNALTKDGSFNVTVLARDSSSSTYPPTVQLRKVSDDFPHDELVRALRGQDVVVSTIGLLAQANEYKLVDAAVEAGVKRFIPSEWGMDNSDINNQELCPVFKGKGEMERYLRSKESEDFSWTALATSIWLEWALETTFLGIDAKAPYNVGVSGNGRKVDYWRDGTHAFSCTTLEYCGAALVALLKHPEVGINQRVFLSPFEASQREIIAELESQLNVEFATAHADDKKIVQGAQTDWKQTKNVFSAYQLVSAGILLPEYKSGFESSGKAPILEHLLEMPKLTLKGIVAEWIAADKSSSEPMATA